MPSPKEPVEKIVLPLRDQRRPVLRQQRHGLGIDPELFKEKMPSLPP